MLRSTGYQQNLTTGRALKRSSFLIVVLFFVTTAVSKIPTARASSPLESDGSTASASSGVRMEETRKQTKQDPQSSSSVINDGITADSNNNNNNRRQVILRLCLVRHGETEGNLQNIVLGQSHSPLSALGMEQAQRLGRSEWMLTSFFWRRYCSDLQRAVHTAQLIRPTAPDDNDVGWILDERLRETLKGPRQGLSKTLDYEQATQERLRRAQERGIAIHEERASWPPTETDDEGWTRITAWLTDLLRDVLLYDAQERRRIQNENSYSQEANTNVEAFTNTVAVLTVAHSGVLRIFLRRLLGDDRLKAHPDATFSSVDGRFALPNTSVTILDVYQDAMDDSDGKSEPTVNLEEVMKNIDIVRLTWTGHLEEARQPQEANEPSFSNQM